MSSGDSELDSLIEPSAGLSHSGMNTASIPPLKRHAACDECRAKKLKCSGESSGCTRCIKQSLACHYSIQKQMGRPPKKRMREEDDTELSGMLGNDQWLAVDNAQLSSFGLSEHTTSISEPPGLFPQFYCAPLRVPHAFPDLLSMENGYSQFLRSHNVGAVDPLPATASPWPDFSSVSAATSSPFTGLSGVTSPRPSSLQNPDDIPIAASQCSCLSYLYLCLSHLSSLSPFPISEHTLCSLFMAAKTAQGVIRCGECPKSYATAMQNVMLTGTLLNVVVDTWFRVSKVDPVELGKLATSPAFASSLKQTSSDPTEAWKRWLRETVRSAIIGGVADSNGRPRCSDAADVLALVTEFEERQRKWHAGSGENHPLSWLPSDNYPATEKGNGKTSSGSEMDKCEEKDYLCLRVIDSIKEGIAKFKFEPDEYPNGTVS